MPDNKTNKQLKIVVAVPRQACGKEIIDILQAQEGIAIAAVFEDGMDAAREIIQIQPDVAIVSESLTGWDGKKVCQVLKAKSPGIGKVLISSDGLPKDIEDIRLNVAEAVVEKNPSLDALQVAIKKAGLRAPRIDVADERILAEERLSIAVTAGKGGVGKSTIACNLAAAFAMDADEGEDSAALFDLYPQFGTAARLLGIKDSQIPGSAEDLKGREDDLDSTLLKAHMAKHPSGLYLLAGAKKTSDADTLCDSVDRIMTELKRCFRYVVLDVPNEITRTFINILPRCHKVVLVANLNDVNAILTMSAMCESLTGGSSVLGSRHKLEKSQIIIVLNRNTRRTNIHRQKVMNRPELQGCKFVDIPEDAKVSNDGNYGMPAVYHRPGSHFSKAILELKRVLTEPS